MTYDNTVPQGNQQIATTQPLILGNFAFIQTDLQVEHIFNGNAPFGAQAEGTHIQASMPNRGTDPGALPAGTNGMYYVKNGGARFYDGTTVCKLTEGVASTNGYQWIGKVLIQWGFKVSSFGPIETGTITFATANIAFPNKCFIVVTTPYYDTGTVSNSVTSAAVSNLLKISFDYTLTGNNKITGFNWMAIGN